jgi:polyferredoxin
MTQIQEEFITKRVRIAGVLILLGLVVESLSLMWNHPLSFIAFLAVGGLLLAAGVVVYLLMLLFAGQEPQ